MKNTHQIKPLVFSLIVAGLISPVISFAQQVTDVGIVNATGGASSSQDNPKNYPSVVTSPVRNTVEVARPVAELSKEYIDNFTAPTATFADRASMLPGAYGFSSNGSGGGDEKIWFRGFKDGNFTMTFDGIPFNDTNDPTHHSQVFFPGPFIGGITSDRSPGTASSLGPANFGGTVGLLSKPIDNTQRITGAYTYGSFNTQQMEAEYASGYTSETSNTKFLINAHHFTSDGAQSFNPQYRDGASFKIESALTSDTLLTAFSSWTHYLSNAGGGGNPATFACYNTGSITGCSPKANYMYVNSNDPTRLDNMAYSHYDVTASFNYLGFNSNLGNGWKLDNKTYFNYYSNQQNYAVFKAPDALYSATATKEGMDKLNSYHTLGNILRLTKDTEYGILRTGIQVERADTPRHQIYANPVTGGYTNPNGASAGGVSFNEDFVTTTIQPYVEFAAKVTDKLTVTPGVKYNSYRMDLTQFADDGTVGNLNGQPYVQHSATYTDVLPFLDARYMLQKNWSVYAQYATGDVIPPSSVFDSTGANVSVLPSPIRTTTNQIGTVYQARDFMVDADIFITKADRSYASAIDPNNPSYKYFYAAPSTTYKGIEVSGNVVLGGGFNLYANAMAYNATYDTTGLAVANVPSDMESVALFYREGPWALGGTVKRIGPQYQDNTNVSQSNEWYSLDPIFITNIYANYTFNNIPSYAKGAKIRFGVNNLFNKNYLIAFTPVSTSQSASHQPGAAANDQVTYTSGIAAYTTLIVDF